MSLDVPSDLPSELDFIRPAIRLMRGYTPGEQPPAGQKIVKLNTNENPFSPSPRVMQAICEVPPELLRRYPNPTADAFRTAASDVLGVQPEMIIAGNGSDDILTIATRTFLGAGDVLAVPDPTYSLYPVLSRLQEAKLISVPWGKDWSLPIEGLLSHKPRAIYLANPNAPSGTLVPCADIATLANAFKGLLLIDEAYVDFADENCLELVRTHANVVVSRTLSKGYALAGLRFGFAIAQSQVIEQMLKAKDSYNCDALSIAAATAAILDQSHARKSWLHIRAERERVSIELRRLKFDVIPSQANFVLATCPDGRGREIYLLLKTRGVLVRYFDLPGLRDKVRITIGTMDENNALLTALQHTGKGSMV